MYLTAHALRTWADDQQIPDLTLAELDYRLTHALGAIFGDPFLRDRLCLKGGTALNKLFFRRRHGYVCGNASEACTPSRNRSITT